MNSLATNSVASVSKKETQVTHKVCLNCNKFLTLLTTKTFKLFPSSFSSDFSATKQTKLQTKTMQFNRFHRNSNFKIESQCLQN